MLHQIWHSYSLGDAGYVVAVAAMDEIDGLDKALYSSY